MSNKKVRSFLAPYVFSFVASALATWVVCALAPTKLKATSLPQREHRGSHVNYAGAAVTSGDEDDFRNQV